MTPHHNDARDNCDNPEQPRDDNPLGWDDIKEGSLIDVRQLKTNGPWISAIVASKDDEQASFVRWSKRDGERLAFGLKVCRTIGLESDFRGSQLNNLLEVKKTDLKKLVDLSTEEGGNQA